MAEAVVRRRRRQALVAGLLAELSVGLLAGLLAELLAVVEVVLEEAEAEEAGAAEAEPAERRHRPAARRLERCHRLPAVLERRPRRTVAPDAADG